MGKATGFLEYDRHEDSWVTEEKRITGFEDKNNIFVIKLKTL